MDWKEELDALVRETAALVALTAAVNVQPQTVIQTTGAAPTNAAPVEPSPPIVRPVDRGSSERERIMARVQGFAAHQERIRREHEAFYSRTMQHAREVAGGRSEDAAVCPSRGMGSSSSPGSQ